MIQYLGNQIISGKLKYDFVVTRRPDLKEAINKYLTGKGRQDLIVEVQ